jgi:methionine synthase II (cobalamin-independent)
MKSIKQTTTIAPFRADHVGSLLRPPVLHDAIARAKQGLITPAELAAVQDQSIRDAVALQESVGIQAITDGEFRRDFWHIDFIHGFDGVGLVKNTSHTFHATDEQPPMFSLTGKVRRTKPVMVPHFEFLQALSPKGTAKFTMPSPAMLHARGDREALRRVYPDIEEFWSDLATAYQQEIAGLYEAGCRYLQIDDTTIAMMGDPKVQETFRSLGDDPKAAVAAYASAINRATSAVPGDMCVTVHTCRGNFKSSWMTSGSYDYVAEIAFSEIDVDGFFLEFDDERSGGFEPLRYIKDAKVALGLVSSKLPQLESKDLLKRRIDEASKYIAMEQLCLSPQCGFASTHHGNNLTVEDEKAKLRLCVETAHDVWGD